MQEGTVRPLVFLSRFPDTEIQRYAALSIAGLALGGYGNNKMQIVEEGAIRPLVDLLRFPDRDVQLSATIAVNSITLGSEMATKAAVLTEGGVGPIIALADKGKDREVISSAVYLMGSLAENEDVKAKMVEFGGIAAVVSQLLVGDIEIKRAAGYFLANICEQSEFHSELEKDGAYEAIIGLSKMEDIECQEYAAFSLAHLASNKDNQVRLVNMGVVRPLVAMLSSDAEPKHYAGLALLKLADNFENHIKIAEEGGIQALLRLGRTRTTDDQLQYKAAITLGQLASNAVRLMPASGNRPSSGSSTAMKATSSTANLGATSASGGGGMSVSMSATSIGHGSRVMNRLRSQVAAQKDLDADKAREKTMEFLDKSLAQTQQEKYLRQASGESAGDFPTPSSTAQLNASMQATDDLLAANREARKK